MGIQPRASEHPSEIENGSFVSFWNLPPEHLIDEELANFTRKLSFCSTAAHSPREKRREPGDAKVLESVGEEGKKTV